MANRLEGADLTGTINMASADTVNHKAGSVGNAAIGTAAGINADKLNQHFHPSTGFNLDDSDTPATTTIMIHHASSAGTVKFVRFSLTDTGSSTNIDFDITKNGSTILSAAINFTNADSNNAIKEGVVSAPTVAAGDKLRAVCTVTSATGALGPFAQIEIDEAYPTT